MVVRKDRAGGDTETGERGTARSDPKRNRRGSKGRGGPNGDCEMANGMDGWAWEMTLTGRAPGVLPETRGLKAPSPSPRFLRQAGIAWCVGPVATTGIGWGFAAAAIHHHSRRTRGMEARVREGRRRGSQFSVMSGGTTEWRQGWRWWLKLQAVFCSRRAHHGAWGLSSTDETAEAWVASFSSVPSFSLFPCMPSRRLV